MYWEGITYLSLAAAALAAARAVMAASRHGYRGAAAWSPLYGVPALLLALAFLAALVEPVRVEALYPLLFLAVFACSSLLRPRLSPLAVLATALGVYAVGVAALHLPPVWPRADPRLEPGLWLVMGLLFAAGGFAAAGVASEPGRRLPGVLGGAAAGLGLALLGWLFLSSTRVASMLYGDPLSLGLLALLVGLLYGAWRGSPLGYAAGLLGFAAAAGRTESMGFLKAYGMAAVGYWTGVYLLLVAAPRVYEEARRGWAEVSPVLPGAAAAVLAAIAAWAAVEPYSSLVPVYAAAAGLLGFGASLGFVAGAVAAPAGFLVAEAAPAYLGVLAVSLASAAAAWLRGRPRWGLVALLLGLAAASYTGAAWVHHSVDARLQPVGLGGLAEAGKPDPTVVHDFFMIYLGAKNESVLYSLTAPKLGREEALRLVSFAHAIRVAAERRGIRDPYNLTQLSLPEKMPSLLLRVEPLGVVVEVPPSAVLNGASYSSGVLVHGLGLSMVSVPGDLLLRLGDGYLALVSDPHRVGGDALRYAIYASMCLSWSRRGSLNETARLLLSALNGSLGAASVEGRVFVAELPAGLVAVGAAVALLAAAPVAAARESFR